MSDSINNHRCSDPAGWAKLVQKTAMESMSPAETYKKLAVDGLSAWKLLLNLAADSTILEIGAGIDSQIHNLAAHSRLLYIVDSDNRRLQFSMRRQDFDRADHPPLCLQCGPDWRLPIADNCVDCIILSRPLETLQGVHGFNAWRLGIGRLADDHTLVGLLREARRVLKPDGQMVAVWENLCNHRILSVSRLWSAPYATHQGYTRLLKNTGFNQLHTHAFRDSNTHLYQLGPIKNTPSRLVAAPPEASGLSFKQRLKRSNLLLPRFAFIASPCRGVQPAVLDRVLEHIASDLAAPNSQNKLEVETHEITRKEKLVIFASWCDNSLIIKLPLNQTALQSESNNAAMLRHLATHSPCPGRFPRPICQGNVSGQPYFVESRLPGNSLSSLLKDRGRLTCLTQVAKLLRELNCKPDGFALQTVELTGKYYFHNVQSCIDSIYASNVDMGLKAHLESYFNDNVFGLSVTVGLSHGDLGVNNLLVNQTTITGLIDWETGTANGLPILDAINYLDSVHRLFNPSILINETIPLQASGRWPVAEEQDFLRDCFEVFNMDPALHEPLVYLAWLRHVSYLMQFWLRFDHSAQQRFIYEIARQLP